MQTTFDTDLAHRIFQARRRASLTREQVAVALEVSGSTVARWERGKSAPSVVKLREIAALTGRPLAYFLGDDEAVLA